jgi:hypothetical protein
LIQESAEATYIKYGKVPARTFEQQDANNAEQVDEEEERTKEVGARERIGSSFGVKGY